MICIVQVATGQNMFNWKYYVMYFAVDKHDFLIGCYWFQGAHIIIDIRSLEIAPSFTSRVLSHRDERPLVVQYL